MKKTLNFLKYFLLWFWNRPGLSAAIFFAVYFLLGKHEIIDQSAGEQLFNMFGFFYFMIHYRIDSINDKIMKIASIEDLSAKHQIMLVKAYNAERKKNLNQELEKMFSREPA